MEVQRRCPQQHVNGGDLLSNKLAVIFLSVAINFSFVATFLTIKFFLYLLMCVRVLQAVNYTCRQQEEVCVCERQFKIEKI